MPIRTVGFIGGSPLSVSLAATLLDGGFTVVCTGAEQSADLVEIGAQVAGDGTVRAVAQVADVVSSCLLNPDALDETVDELLEAERVPAVIEMSTLPISAKERARHRLLARDSDLLDAPVCGTPEMVSARSAVIYVSGARAFQERAAGVLRAMSPHCVFVGGFGAGTKTRLIIQLLCLVHVTATAEAMAYAKLAGMDLAQIAELISSSPGAVSGQFKIRAPLMIAGQFAGRHGTVETALSDCDDIIAYGKEIDAPLGLVEIADRHFRQLMAAGRGDADPAQLFDAFVAGALARDCVD